MICTFWPMWYLIGGRVNLLEALGPLSFWSLPPAASAIGWSVAALGASGANGRSKACAVMLGTLASVMPAILLLGSVVLFLFAIFLGLVGMVLFVAALVLIVWFGYLGTWALCRLALQQLASQSGARP
jgi:hypothetical protein